MYQRLSHNLPAVPPPAPSSYGPDQSGGYGAPRYGLEQVSPPQARTPAQHFPSSMSAGKGLSGAPSLGGPGARSAARR